jgi:hypothetical protein
MKKTKLRASAALALITTICIIFCGLTYAIQVLQTGSRYKIIGPMYLSGIYNQLNNRQITKETAQGSLTAVQFSGPEVGFQCKVPVGTVMTIIGPAPKRFPLFFLADQYFVRIDPDLSRGLDVVLELNRGVDGNLDGLSPALFERL